jgi:hypothetical protein
MGASIDEAALDSTPASERADTRYQSFLDALDRNFRLRCECQYAALGHPSADVCFERLRTPAFAKACELGAFALYADDVGNRYACLGRLREASSACIETRGCEALAECEEERAQARGTCGGVVSADAEFGRFVEACERNERLGVGSACPDAVIEGTPLGLAAFEGSTTGAGDDVTLSCHWPLENFESADLVVAWRAPEAGTYRFGTENSAFSTQLGVLDGCGGAELACASSDGSTFGAAALTLTLAAEQTVFIVLEGYYLTESGYVRLNVSGEP